MLRQKNMVKAVIVYGTRYGATEDTSKVIAEALCQEGIETKVINAKKEKIQDISEFQLLVIGSGIRMGRWTKEPENFLKQFQKELQKKKVVLFVCCGGANPLTEGEEKIKEMEETKRKYLVDKADQYDISPIALGFFGGIYDFNKMSWFLRKSMSSVKTQLQEAGFKETKSDVYDTRSLDSIRNWAKQVAKLVT